MRRISKKRQAILKEERLLAQELAQKQDGKCAICGQLPDWRGLSISHTKPKKMGGTSHIYTIDELELLCGKCHAGKHGIKER